MDILSWLGLAAGPWTWRHYLFVAVVALVVAAGAVFRAMRQGTAEAREGPLYQTTPRALWRCVCRRKTGRSGSR
jgi:hypothetical protein